MVIVPSLHKLNSKSLVYSMKKAGMAKSNMMDGKRITCGNLRK